MIIDLDEIWRDLKANWVYGDSNDYFIDEEGLKSITAFQKDRIKQIKEYLGKGGNLFIWGSKRLSHIVDIRKGQNYDPIIIDLLSFVSLNSKDFTIKNQTGKVIQIKPEFQSFFEKFQPSYSFYFDKYSGSPIGYVTNTSLPVTLNIPAGNGNIILLPELRLVKGNVVDAFSDFDKILKQKLHIKYEAVEAPTWINDYSFGSEKKEILALNVLIEEKKIIEDKITKQKDELNYYSNLKRLLFSTGKDLELIVEEIFKELGYSTKETEENRDDLIIQHNEQVAVIEIKGVKGSAAEKYAAQLTKWVSTYYVDNGFNPKGILIVNAFKDKALKDRIEAPFPNQMLQYSERQEICLITTVQLLEIYLDFKVGVLSFENVTKLLFETIGVVTYNSKNQIKEVSLTIAN